eukprot:Nk52_evm3s379 gene=Nk52_evmTU3s379
MSNNSSNTTVTGGGTNAAQRDLQRARVERGISYTAGYLEGQLEKWTNYASGWQPRWFVLDNGILSYYTSPHSRDCRAQIDMRGARVEPDGSGGASGGGTGSSIAPVEDPEGREIRIKTASRTIYMRAGSVGERQRWLLALHVAIERRRINHSAAKKESSSGGTAKGEGGGGGAATSSAPHSSVLEGGQSGIVGGIIGLNIAAGSSATIREVQQALETKYSEIERCRDSTVGEVRAVLDIYGHHLKKTPVVYENLRKHVVCFHTNTTQLLQAVECFSVVMQQQKAFWSDRIEKEKKRREVMEATHRVLVERHSELEKAQFNMEILTEKYEQLKDYNNSNLQGEGGDGANADGGSNNAGASKRNSWRKSLIELNRRSTFASSTADGVDLHPPEGFESEEDEDDEFFDAIAPTPEQERNIVALSALREALSKSACSPNERKAFESFEDSLLVRFIIARDYNIDKATDMFQKYVEWRKTFQPHKLDLRALSSEHQKGSVYFHRFDKNMQPCVVLHIAKNVPENTDKDIFLKLIVYYVERAIKLSPMEANGRFTLLVDFKGLSLSNNDLGSTKDLFALLASYYPERLGSCFLVEAPWVFNAVWYAIKNVLPPKTVQKISFIKKKTNLLKFFEPENLQQCFGGKSAYTFKWDKDTPCEGLV